MIAALLATQMLVLPAAHAQIAKQPTIGLVLGGGGARGAAHVGVIRKLEELRIPISCVVGTSMGGLVAGAYSTGMDSAQMSQALNTADWRDIFQDAPNFTELSTRNKKVVQDYIPGLEVGVKDGKVKASPAVLGGQKIKFFINKLVRADQAEQRIDGQQLPLALIATDIVSGKKVVLNKGDLPSAMRATMSVPGAIAPVKYNGHTLVDGGLVDNVPVGEARTLCQPDVIIAVNVGSPLLKEEDIETSPLSVTAQMLNILTEQNVERSLAQLNSKVDVYIRPELKDITATDFLLSAKTIEEGYAAANAVTDKLKKLSASTEQYAAWQATMAQRRIEPKPIDAVQIVVGDKEQTREFQAQLSQPIGAPLNTPQLEAELLKAYGTGKYANMDYQLATVKDKNILRVTPVEKSWGPNYIRSGINLAWGDKGESDYNLRMAYHMTQLNKRGGELMATGQIGTNNQLGLNYYQPFSANQRWFTELNGSFASNSVDFYQDNKIQTEYKARQTELNAALGYNFERYGTFKVGAVQRWQAADLRVGRSDVLPSSKQDNTQGWYVSAQFDRTNELYFPTKGWSARMQYFDAFDYNKLSAELMGVYSLSDFVFTGKAAYVGSPKGDLPLNDAATLGGVNFLSGLSSGQMRGGDLKYAGLRVERIIGKMPLGIRGDVRLGLNAEAGKMEQRYSETQRAGWVRSLGLYLGAETPVGPAYLGVAKATGGDTRVYLFIGTP
jgi:NTE family protein